MLANMFWITLEVSRDSTRGEKREKFGSKKFLEKSFQEKVGKILEKVLGKKLEKVGKSCWESFGKVWKKLAEKLEKVVWKLSKSCWKTSENVAGKVGVKVAKIWLGTWENV